MHSTTNPKPTDDPHDVIVVAPDVALMAPTDEELSRLARSLRPPAAPQIRTAADLPACPTVPPVDTTFRPAATGDVQSNVKGNVKVDVPVVHGRTMGARAARAILVALLLAACTAAAKVSWQSYGDAAEAMIAQWAPQRVLAILLPSEKTALPAQPAPAAVEANAADSAAPPPGSPAPSTPEGAAPVAAASVDPTPSPGAMANDTASLRQEVEQLKASIEELKASQQQMSRDLANASQVRSSSEVKPSEARAFAAKPSEIKPSEIKPSEIRAPAPNPRPKLSAHSWRAPAAPARRPIAPQQAAAYPALPPPAPYVPRQTEPQPPATAETLADPELTAVPRPPMPLR
jgi:hypothetical protein